MLDAEQVKTPGTDEWWMVRLSKKLGDRLERVNNLEQWYEGTPPLAMPDNDTKAFRRIQELARLNLAELVVNAVMYRIQPLAVRTAVDQDSNGDDVVRKIWNDNDMKVVFSQIVEWMLALSVSYSIVDKRTDGSDGVLITAEHPNQVITEPDPTDPKHSLAGFKIYRDDLTNSDVAVLYMRGEPGDKGYKRVARHYGTSTLPRKNARKWKMNPSAWEWSDEEFEVSAVNYVPVFEFDNRSGKGEFEKHIPTLKRIQHTILQRMIIIALQAFRQRGIKGVPNTDEDGKEIDYSEIFTADPGSLWIVPKAAEFWESGQADLTPVLSSVKDDINHLAATSTTPLHMVIPDAASGSAEGAGLQREGLIFKTEAAINRIDGRVAAQTACALELLGETLRADLSELKVVWASPRRSSLQEKAEAGRAAKDAGVPWRLRMEKFIELTPDEIAEAESQRADDAFAQVITEV